MYRMYLAESVSTGMAVRTSTAVEVTSSLVQLWTTTSTGGMALVC